MKYLLLFTYLIFTMNSTVAQITSLDDFQWKNRLLIIYATDQKSTQLQEQLDEITETEKGYNERNLKVIILKNQKIEIWNSNENHNLQFNKSIKELNIEETQPYQNLLIGKDGGVKLRKNSPISTEKLFDTIDAMPMRQREMRNKN